MTRYCITTLRFISAASLFAIGLSLSMGSGPTHTGLKNTASVQFAAAFAKDGDDNSGSSNSGSGGGGDSGDDDSGDDNSGSGSGSSNSGSGSGDDSARDSEDDDDDDSASRSDRRDNGNRRRGRRDDDDRRDRAGSDRGPSAEINGANIEVTFDSGIREEIENGIFERKDARGRTVVERRATAADRRRLERAANRLTRSVAPSNDRSAQAAKVEVAGNNIEVVYSDGWKEEIENGRYELKDPSNNTVIERPARTADINRLRRLTGF